MGSHVFVAIATVLDIWVNPISYMHPQTTTVFGAAAAAGGCRGRGPANDTSSSSD